MYIQYHTCGREETALVYLYADPAATIGLYPTGASFWHVWLHVGLRLLRRSSRYFYAPSIEPLLIVGMFDKGL
jgi:hypothetical protein